jgi:hypothetical protein
VTTSNLNDAGVLDVFSRLESYAMASGRFDAVNGHEPKSAPGNGVTYAVWIQSYRPALSGLSATSGLLLFNSRIYKPFTSIPYDAIDPQVMSATLDILAAMSGDFQFGGMDDVRNVDLLGSTGYPLMANAGYVEVDRHMYRCMTIQIPIIMNDLFVQVA